MVSVLALLGALVLAGPLGTAFVRWVLSMLGEQSVKDSAAELGAAQRSGWLIGTLERILVAIGVALGSWEVIAAVVALKTVSRYKELDDKVPAEYFLVGSLASLAWAVAIAFVFLAADSLGGDNWIPALRRLIAPD